MLELYHKINSVCAQKVRLSIIEKQIPVQEHLMKLNGDQYHPDYLKLNPNGVVPTLVHDGRAIRESTIILYYLDDVFPQVPLMPVDPLRRAEVRLLNKLVDDYVHNACIVLTFAIAFRPGLLKMSLAEREAHFADTPIRNRATYKRDVIENGLDSGFVGDALQDMLKFLKAIDAGLKNGPYIVGDTYSNAEAAAIPYVLRLELLGLSGLWARYPAVVQWWSRMRARDSTQKAILSRMAEADWAPFRNSATDPWPKVEALVKAAA
ncbi:MAG: glutathione S-transferase family protein [Burkholderiaceae bacterium]|nr:MAG: glutathione S-transferase family protein [Burkholderiaceae bacterium]